MFGSRGARVGLIAALVLSPTFVRAQAESPCGAAGAAAWKAVTSHGGVVPEIEEDRTQAPPAWWRYPDPRRSAELLAAEAAARDGLYSRVAAGELEAGDIVVRAAGAGACGRMAVVAGKLEGRWVLQDAGEEGGAARTSDDAFFVEGKTLRPEASAFRVRVKSDSTDGHVRELGRDLAHLERTIAERPPLLAKGGRGAVDEKVHELVDEAWSLSVDPAADLQRRALAGRGLALGAALDWPGAAESAAAVLDDVLARAPQRVDAVVARASLYLLAGQPARAATLAEAAVALPNAPARARYVLARALLASGKTAEGLAALRRYLAAEPRDPRANRLAATAGREPALAPAPAGDAAARFTATADRAGLASGAYGFSVAWPIPWRVVGQSVTEENGLLLDFTTGRAFDDEGAPQRGTAVLLAQRPANASERAALVKKAGRNMFPTAKLKALPPLVPGSRREGFRERADGEPGVHAGEVTTLEHDGVVYFIVLNAPQKIYEKLKPEYEAVVKSLTFARKPTAAAP
jgi:tetratricopeptide (TPR) repeat protein